MAALSFVIAPAIVPAVLRYRHAAARAICRNRAPSLWPRQSRIFCLLQVPRPAIRLIVFSSPNVVPPPFKADQR